MATQLHGNTVGSVLRALIAQGYVNKFGDCRPYVYRASLKGEHLACRLLQRTERKEDIGWTA